MGRTRKHNRHLPPRLRLSHGCYFRVTTAGWQNLGREYGPALKQWAELESAPPVARLIGDAITLYCADKISALAVSTRREYQRICGTLRAVFGDTPIAEVRPVHIAQYLEKRTKRTSANREMAVLSSIYNYAMRLGFAESNPCRGVRRNTEKPRVRIPTVAELSVLRLKATPALRRAIELSLMTALRVSDLIRLDIADVTERGLVVRTSKTGKAICIRITEQIAELIHEAKGRREIGPLLLSSRNRRWTYAGLDSAWDRLRASTEILDLHWHDLRAWALTSAKQQYGRDKAQDLGAHKSPSTTDAYIRDREVIDVDPVRI